MDSTEKSLDHLTFADLRVHYGTGRAFLIRQEYRRNVYGYRKGVKKIWETWRKKIGYSWPRV